MRHSRSKKIPCGRVNKFNIHSNDGFLTTRIIHAKTEQCLAHNGPLLYEYVWNKSLYTCFPTPTQLDTLLSTLVVSTGARSYLSDNQRSMKTTMAVLDLPVLYIVKRFVRTHKLRPSILHAV